MLPLCEGGECMPGDRGRVAALNNALRKEGRGGQIFMTSGVRARGDSFVQLAIEAVRAFSTFTADNDPHGEHDFGSVTVAWQAGARHCAGFFRAENMTRRATCY